MGALDKYFSTTTTRQSFGFQFAQSVEFGNDFRRHVLSINLDFHKLNAPPPWRHLERTPAAFLDNLPSARVGELWGQRPAPHNHLLVSRLKLHVSMLIFLYLKALYLRGVPPAAVIAVPRAAMPFAEVGRPATLAAVTSVLLFLIIPTRPNQTRTPTKKCYIASLVGV